MESADAGQIHTDGGKDTAGVGAAMSGEAFESYRGPCAKGL